ncbi:glucokinase [Endozoicomonadaceae bacterium StTr2]
MQPYTALVGDIGGTNARFALVEEGSLELRSIEALSGREYPDLEAAVKVYLERQGITSIHTACLAVAGPIINGRVSFTNSPWTIEQSHFQQTFELEAFELLNDFAAQALSVPYLKPDELLKVGPELTGDTHAVRLVIGPGTGLGVCSLVETACGWRALPGEGGNADFAPIDDIDIEILRFVRQKIEGNVGWERLLSGSGLELLYQAHSYLEYAFRTRSAPDITRKALEDRQSLSFRVVEHFCRLLGHCAGNAALTTGARGGVYIAGGIIPRIRDIFVEGAFRQAFEQRDKMLHFMEGIPTSLMLAEFPGLTGAAAWLKMNAENS